VISGFLITSTILSRWGELGKIDIPAFYRLRFARIAPCLVALLVILSVLDLAGATGFVINPERTNLPGALFAALTFHVNWLESQVGYLPGSWDILWSLSIEEAFYLAYPILCRFLKPKYLIVSAALLLILGPFCRVVLEPYRMSSDYAYFANLDCIALGCLTAAIPLRLGNRVRFVGWGALALIVFARRLVFPKPIYSLGLDVTIVAIAAALAIQDSHPGPVVRFVNPLRWFGRHSYEVYLTHMFAVLLGAQWFNSRHLSMAWAPVWYAGIISMAAWTGYAVSRWYSEPMNRRLRGKPLLTATANV
jgi:peptidoglycan/LPS O-acetylase OafA/YrhL